MSIVYRNVLYCTKEVLNKFFVFSSVAELPSSASDAVLCFVLVRKMWDI